MFRKPLNDPLLAFAGIGLTIMSVLLWIGLAGVTLAIPFVLFGDTELADALAAAGDPIPYWQLLGAIMVFLAGIFSIIAAAIYFVRLLRRIVDSVSQGDPFIPDNAQRLTLMAWIALGTQVVAFLLELLGYWIGARIPQGLDGQDWSFTVDGDLTFSPEGLILVLVIFILARVFRTGTQMREDLEGTV